MKNITLLSVILFLASLLFLNFSSIAKTGNSLKNSTVVADSVDLSEYVGKFKLAEGSPVESILFVIKDGKLVSQAGEYPETILAVKMKDVFENAEMGGVFTFLRTDSKITKVKVEVQGYELLGEKVQEDKK
ncbi:MAG: hypothetical protein V4683_09775 [Bacteroidota bacterium]